MKFTLLMTAIALGGTANASPLLRQPAQIQQPTPRAQHNAIKTEWLHLISGDDDECEDDDDGDEDCDEKDRNNAATPQTPSAPPQNGLFSTGKPPVVTSN